MRLHGLRLTIQHARVHVHPTLDHMHATSPHLARRPPTAVHERNRRSNGSPDHDATVYPEAEHTGTRRFPVDARLTQEHDHGHASGWQVRDLHRRSGTRPRGGPSARVAAGRTGLRPADGGAAMGTDECEQTRTVIAKSVRGKRRRRRNRRRVENRYCAYHKTLGLWPQQRLRPPGPPAMGGNCRRASPDLYMYTVQSYLEVTLGTR